MRKLLIAALLVLPVSAPAAADERILQVFGDEPCPANTICVRSPIEEKYRIPKRLRQSPTIAPERQSWAARASSVTDAGAKTGIGSCTAVGPGGWTGCYAEQMRAARAERQQRTAESTPALDD